jgi:hypothetical protein
MKGASGDGGALEHSTLSRRSDYSEALNLPRAILARGQLSRRNLKLRETGRDLPDTF